MLEKLGQAERRRGKGRGKGRERRGGDRRGEEERRGKRKKSKGVWRGQGGLTFFVLLPPILAQGSALF